MQSPINCNELTRDDCHLSESNFRRGTKGRSVPWVRIGSPKIHNLVKNATSALFP
jgi:hypothetical protein